MHSFRSVFHLLFVTSLVALSSSVPHQEPCVRRPLSSDGGQQVKIFQVPYLLQLRDENNKLFCAGALVSPQHVVTAASCFDDVDYANVKVVGGAATIEDEGVQRSVSEISKHPDYSSESKHSNVAVLKLDAAMEVGRNIRTIPLCKEGVFEGELVQTPGWGRMGISDPVNDNVRSARIPVTSQDKCDMEFTASGEKKLFCVTGHPGKTHCVGDSGGPAVYRGKLCGIIAMTDKCSEPGENSGFTNVLDVKEFIEGVLA